MGWERVSSVPARGSGTARGWRKLRAGEGFVLTMIGGETCGELRSIKISMGWADSGLFNEKYRVVSRTSNRQRNHHGHRTDDRQQRPGDAS